MGDLDTVLIVTVDTERDYSPKWRTPPKLSYKSITEAIPEKLARIFADYGVRPTYFISPEVLLDIESCVALRSLKDCELGAHLHGDYICPHIKTWDLADPNITVNDMQWEYPMQIERAKLGTLTELFIQQIGFRPRSFRAGRFGVGHHSGRWLMDLGYWTDSSVTPHLRWTSAKGREFPDFRHLPEYPYQIDRNGNVWEKGNASLLEIPITILPFDVLGTAYLKDVLWFRPWYEDSDTLCTILKSVAGEPSIGGIKRPLVMMFHSEELIPGASPYTQTESDVVLYMNSLKQVFQLAENMGIQSCSLKEYYRRYMEFSGIPVGEEVGNSDNPGKSSAYAPSFIDVVSEFIERGKITAQPWLRKGYRFVRSLPARTSKSASVVGNQVLEFWRYRRILDKNLRLPAGLVDNAIDQNHAQPWFKYIYRERANRWDVWQPMVWLVNHYNPIDPVLETGCGVGFDLIWLAQRGFNQLFGFDIDQRAIDAGVDISSKAGYSLSLWVDDGLSPQGIPQMRFSIILAKNWTMLNSNFDLDQFLDIYLPYLSEEGALIFDVIDNMYNQIPNNQYLTSDWGKPIILRRPSEYVVRISQDNVRTSVERHNLQIVEIMTKTEAVPRVIYIVKRATI
jgi:SAM-dependent methyltransferase